MGKDEKKEETDKFLVTDGDLFNLNELCEGAQVMVAKDENQYIAVVNTKKRLLMLLNHLKGLQEKDV